jgi:hypothetical protein
MKKLLLVAAFLLLPVGAAFADPDIGCGPGTVIWQGSKGLLPKVLGATTNGSFGLQTFGISFGTFGCHTGGTVTANARLRMFAGANLDRLAREMAVGEGEVLATFAHLKGIAPADQPAFYAFSKTHFAEIFAGDDVTEYDVLGSLDRLLSSDTQLAVYAKS